MFPGGPPLFMPIITNDAWWSDGKLEPPNKWEWIGGITCAALLIGWWALTYFSGL